MDSRGKHLEVTHFEADHLFILENRHERRNLYPLHHHTVNKLLYITSGRGHLFLEDRDLPVKKNDFALIRAGAGHKLSDDSKELIHLYGIYFGNAIARDAAETRLIANLTTGPAPCLFSLQESPFLARIIPLLKEIIYEANTGDPHSPILQRGKLLEILIILARYLSSLQEPASPETARLSPTDQKVRKIIRYLETNYYQHFFSEELAAMVPVSKRQFVRVFQKLTGTTPTDYLNKIRIKRAGELLSTGEKEIITVCFDVGFNDLSYFYRTFKRYLGQTPREFLQQARAKETAHPGPGGA